MFKKITSMFLSVAIVCSMLSSITYAAVTDEEEIIEEIENIQTTYEPNKTYFVSNSTQKWVGEDNISGDKTLGCFAPGTTNSHGRFGGLWQSMGFANYVFYNIYGTMPQFGYHCNNGELNGSVEVIGRYASECKYVRGSIDGHVNEENVKNLLSKAKIGDIIVAAPYNKCNSSGKAMVIVDIKDTHITVYHADYRGNCGVSEDMITYDALAQFHCISLLRSKSYPYPEPIPPTAVTGISVSTDDISLYESIDVKWDKVKHTDKYKIFLLDSGENIISEKESTSLFASFIFDKAGTYKVKVVANNEYGDSEASLTKTITVHNNSVVTFLDYDGTVITTQKVEYGKNATAPNVPQRKGYQFAGWNKSLENITEPTEITATYEIEEYTIRYYDVGGKNVLSTESVKYLGKANLPTNYNIDNGYVFAGWQISFDSVGTDYNCVDGDMSLIATQKWSNLNLPISITADNIERDSSATYYSADLVVKNHDEDNLKNFKIIATLKASNGKTLKSVVLDEISLAANEETTLNNRKVVFSEKATTIEFVAVGMVGNSKTGGAYSKTVSSSILDNSSWGSWSDWTTDNLISSYDDYESKTQYRNRSKAYTTGTSKSMDGWTLYDTTSTTGSWSSWSSTAVSAFTTDAQKREVQTKVVPATYQTRYTYNRSVNNAGTLSSYNTSYHPNYQSIDLSYALTAKGTTSGHTRYGSYAGSYGTYLQNYWWNQGTYQKLLTAAYTQYQYMDTYYTYHFWKWNDWSDWSDTYTSNDGVEERTVYRYRNQSDGGDDEDSSGESIKIEGVIGGVETDFTDLDAVIMVYKKCNTDPTEEQLEYVGETIIGAGNTYSFEFIPRETPSSETGDFIIALGIEGADRLVNVDVVKAEVPTYQVKFIVDGQEYAIKSAAEGESVESPEPPEKNGYTFVKWSKTLTGIETDTSVTAEFEPNEYSIVFVDWESNKVTTINQKYGDTIQYPELEGVEGIQNRSWDKLQEGITNVNGSMIAETRAVYETYTVTFSDDTGTISTQTVSYGDSATIPTSNAQVEGMKFAGWVGSCSPSYITHSVDFTPTYVYENTVALPTAMVSKVNDDGSQVIQLYCETEGSKIYYIIESHDENASLNLLEEEQENNFIDEATEYTGEITLASNESITFISYADGMNASIPVTEENSSEELYLNIFMKSNSIREYRTTLEGDVSFEFINNSPEYSYGTFTLCFYDQRGVLLDFIPKTIDIIPGTNTVDFQEVCIEDINYSQSKAITCKLITWLSGDGVVPLSDFVQVDIK